MCVRYNGVIPAARLFFLLFFKRMSKGVGLYTCESHETAATGYSAFSRYHLRLR